jgi:hypothetical protein
LYFLGNGRRAKLFAVGDGKRNLGLNVGVSLMVSERLFVVRRAS